jgi:hypothetical protein
MPINKRKKKSPQMQGQFSGEGIMRFAFFKLLSRFSASFFVTNSSSYTIFHGILPEV